MDSRISPLRVKIPSRDKSVDATDEAQAQNRAANTIAPPADDIIGNDSGSPDIDRQQNPSTPDSALPLTPVDADGSPKFFRVVPPSPTPYRLGRHDQRDVEHIDLKQAGLFTKAVHNTNHSAKSQSKLTLFDADLEIARPETRLGAGTFCYAVKAVVPSTGHTYAVKIARSPAEHATVVREALILSRLGPDAAKSHVVAFHGYAPALKGVVLTQYAMSMDRYFAHRRLSADRDSSHLFVPQNVWARWALELLDALEYIHARGVVHCDVKPDNILLNDTLTPCIGDFSSALINGPGDLDLDLDLDPKGSQADPDALARRDSPKASGIGAISIEYAAPEVLRRKDVPPTSQSDLFSYGLVLLEAATGAPPYSGAVKGFTQKYQWAVRGAALDGCLLELVPRISTVRPALEVILEHRAGPSAIRSAIHSIF